MCFKVTLVKFQVHNFNLEGTCVVHHQLTKPAEFGMLEVANVCQY